MKKIASIVLALILVLAMAAPAMAASITINSAENVSVAGKTFNAYKILDLELVGTDNVGYVYTVPAALEDFYATEFSLDKSAGDFDYEVTQKIAAMTSNSDALFAFAAKALAAAKTAGITPATTTGSEGATSVEFENLPLGYYVIEDTGATTPISALMLDSTNPDLTVTLKADKPSLEKKIDGATDTDETTEGLVDYNNAAIGDKVPYVLTSAVPDMTGYTKYFYVVTDTLSAGLTFNNDVAITLGGETLTANEDYTVTVNNTDGTTTVKIVFTNFIQYKAQAGAEIKITYSATVDTDAVIGETGNPNKVNLTYSNNPNITPDGENEPDEDDPKGVTPNDETRTYVTEIEIIKVDDKGNRLTGAEFTLTGTKLNTVIVEKEVFVESTEGTFWKLIDGTYTATDPATVTDTSKYVNDDVKYVKETKQETIVKATDVTYKGTVGDDGVLKFEGLASGTYEIKEITAPDGYNLLKDEITLVIGWTAPGDESTNCTWSYTWTFGDNEEGMVASNSNKITVKNNTGVELPSTGGMGTTIFYIVGGLLIAGAAIALITKKRMASK